MMDTVHLILVLHGLLNESWFASESGRFQRKSHFDRELFCATTTPLLVHLRFLGVGGETGAPFNEGSRQVLSELTGELLDYSGTPSHYLEGFTDPTVSENLFYFCSHVFSPWNP